jgi:hypothetical protein
LARHCKGLNKWRMVVCWSLKKGMGFCDFDVGCEINIRSIQVRERMA